MSKLFSSDEESSVKAPRRVFIWLLPFIAALVMAGLFLTLGWQNLMPAVEVEISRARISDAAVTTREGETVFQAAGWIEAAPYRIRATALVSGVVNKVYVIDGQKVVKGQLLVSLIDDDLKLELANAEAELVEITLDKKKRELEYKAEQVKLQELDSMKESAIAIADRLKHKAKVFRSSGDAIPDFEKDQADLEYQEKKKVVDEFPSRKELITAQLKLMNNSIDIATAKIETQKVKIDKIKLDLSRTKIMSPADGIIEHLYAREGRKQMLSSDNEHSTTVARIFNPKEIQVRVDVPLSDAGKIKIGLKAKIHIEFLKDPVAGHITSIYGHADYQKNTLEVKVKIPGGHMDLRPDMLAQVEFISDAPVESAQAEKVSGIFIKKESLIDGSKVWVVNSDNKAVLKLVEKGKREKEGWVEILSGVNAGEKVILAPHGEISEGASVKVGKIHE